MGITGTYFSMPPTSETFAKISQIASLWSYQTGGHSNICALKEEELRKAHEQTETSHTRGKLVIKID